MRERRQKSGIPLLAAAGVWLLYPMVLPLYRLADFSLVAALSIGVYLILDKLVPARTIMVREKRRVDTGDKNADEMINKGNAAVVTLQDLASSIRDHTVRSQAALLEGRLTEIVQYIEAHPGKAPVVRRFFGYYLPTTLKLFTSFKQLEGKGPESGDNVSSAMRSIRTALDSIVTAYRNQLDALYADVKLDISTDIEVLETMMRSDGLLKREM